MGFLMALSAALPPGPLFYLPLSAFLACICLALRSLTSFASCSAALSLSSRDSAFFLRISSMDIPTTAFWMRVVLRERFLMVVSTLIFLLKALQAWVQVSFTGLIFWWKRLRALVEMK